MEVTQTGASLGQSNDRGPVLVLRGLRNGHGLSTHDGQVGKHPSAANLPPASLLVILLSSSMGFLPQHCPLPRCLVPRWARPGQTACGSVPPGVAGFGFLGRVLELASRTAGRRCEWGENPQGINTWRPQFRSVQRAGSGRKRKTQEAKAHVDSDLCPQGGAIKVSGCFSRSICPQ